MVRTKAGWSCLGAEEGVVVGVGFGRNSACLYADEMIHRRNRGNPWGNASNHLEGRGSDALGGVDRGCL